MRTPSGDRSCIAQKYGVLQSAHFNPQQVLQLAKLGIRIPARKLSGKRELAPRTKVVKTARKKPVTNPSTKKKRTARNVAKKK